MPVILGVPIEPSSGSGVTSARVLDFRKIISNADRILLSPPVIVEYGVIIGLWGDRGLEPFIVNELVFFKIDFGFDPKIGLVNVLSFFCCAGNISLFAISRNVVKSGAGITSNLDGLR